MPLPFEKTVTERYPIGFQFYGELPPGVHITSATVSARNITDDVDDNSVLQSTGGAVENTLVKIGVKDGVAGKTYRITCKVFLSSNPADNLQETRDMIVTA